MCLFDLSLPEKCQWLQQLQQFAPFCGT
jgi:hypothetical protein